MSKCLPAHWDRRNGFHAQFHACSQVGSGSCLTETLCRMLQERLGSIAKRRMELCSGLAGISGDYLQYSALHGHVQHASAEEALQELSRTTWLYNTLLHTHVGSEVRKITF